jgi:hypothetical protein
MEKSTRERVTRGLLAAAIVALAPALFFAACAGPPFSGTGLTPDAGADADSGIAAADAATPADASDGGVVGADATPPFCANAGAHDFCEDFDTNGVPGKFVTVTQSTLSIGNGAKVTADTKTYMSAPESALAQTPALLRQNGDQAEALLAATISGSSSQPGSRLRMTAEMEIGAGCIATADGAVVALVGTGQYSLAIAVLPTEARLVELIYGSDGGIADAVTHSFSTVPATWFELGIQLDLKAKTAIVSIDGAPALDNLPLVLSPPNSASSAAVFLGAEVKDSQAISGGCQVHVDNVLFDIL